MDSSEIELNLLNTYLSEDDLNSLIQNSTCLKTLNCLLRLKQGRISDGKCEKLCFSIESIYLRHDPDANIDLKTELLATALQLVEDSDKQLLQAIKYFTDTLCSSQNEDELYESLSLLSVILNYCKGKDVIEINKELDRICEGILIVLKNASKRVTTFMVTNFLSSYIDRCSTQIYILLLNNIVEFIKATKNLDIFCLLFDECFSKGYFNVTTLNDTCLLLQTCIISKDGYLQKQAVYLLSKIADKFSKTNDPAAEICFLDANVADYDLEKVWRNYFILLDASNEKQLHIIEPSLHLFNSIKALHPRWRICLYKIYLNHSQNSVVYSVAMFILQNESELFSCFADIVQELLTSINKNEYSSSSNRVFKEFGDVTRKLASDKEFKFLIEESLKVAWIPTAAWCFYKEMFHESAEFNVDVVLLEKLMNKFKLVPHTYIREGCTKVILNYYINNVTIASLNEFLTVSTFLLNIDEHIFEIFIKNNKEIVFCHIQNLQDQFENATNTERCNLLEIEVIIKTFRILQRDMLRVPNLQILSEKTDLVYFHLFENFDVDDVEKYVENRISCIQNHENAKFLLLLNKKMSSSKITQISVEILLETNQTKFTTIQKVIAFRIVNNNHSQDFEKVARFWKSKICSSTEKTDERITQAFVELYFRYLSATSVDDEILEAVNMLQNVLDSQSKAIFTILENIHVLLKYLNIPQVASFLDRCFEEFLNLSKTSNFKVTANVFLSQIYQTDFLENCTDNKIVTFSEKLLNISNNYNSIACIVSEKIAQFSECNPKKAIIFIPLIVEFILHGIVINKNERVEYSVCQDIGRKFSFNANNPNLEAMSVRLWGLEAMLNLIKNQNLDDAANKFVNLLVEKYMKNFNKRYFPDSQIHLCKLRIMQALLLLHNFIKKEQPKLVNMLIESFLIESHQPSVKHLMQWLLIRLLRNDDCSIKLIEDKLEKFDNSRPSTVSGFIPVLYHLTLYQNEMDWDQIVEILLPCTMGPQFKLRIYSQIALLKLYKEAEERKYICFLNKYKFLYNSLKQVIEASSKSCDSVNINQEFLDYFSLENSDCSTIYYTIPKANKVAIHEWENLHQCVQNKQFKHLSFKIEDNDTIGDCENETPIREYGENIQKKITPWKDMLNDNPSEYTNNFILVTTLLEKPANLGGLSRTCEVFGIKQIVMKTSKITSDKEFKSLSMSSENWVDIVEVKVEDLQSFIFAIKRKGYSVIGAEQTSESVKLEEFKFPKMTVLVLGNEKEGIPANIIPLLDTCVEIPQFGVVRSLNVHVAGAIIMWEYCKQQQL